jgi:hypothetical protein
MDAPAQLIRLINGYRISQAIHVAASIGLSDHLIDGPRSLAELAAATGSDPQSLGRLLRALATVGVYQELPDGRFESTPMSDELRSDADRALASWATFIGRPYIWQAWGALGHSVRTGENAFASVHGQSVWDYRTEHPVEGGIFDAGMTAMSRYVADAVLEAYDFGVFATVADVGGGRGAMLAAILSRYPQMRGVLFDQPQVVAGAPTLLARAGVADRCEVVAGDLFAAVPADADAYVLKSILHDWRDEQAIAILRTCRQAMKPGAAILLLERVLARPAGPGDEAKAFSDLNMLVAPGGQERTQAEYESLLSRAGLDLVQVVPTSSDVSVVEARDL